LLLERPVNGGPCLMLKLRQMGTQGVHMKGLLPWLVPLGCLAVTRDFRPALAALVCPVHSIVSPPHTFSLHLSHPSASWAQGQAVVPRCLSLNTCLWKCFFIGTSVDVML
jgi:hypothetical protein